MSIRQAAPAPTRHNGSTEGRHLDFLRHAARLLDGDGAFVDDTVAEDAFRDARLFILDAEMSGPNPAMHELLDIGWVVASAAEPIAELSSWGSKVRPKHIGNAEIGALKVVGYSPRDWKDAIELEAAMERLVADGAGAIFAGWGFGQDLAFVAESLRRTGAAWPFAPVVLDIQVVARRLLKGTGDVDRFNLGHVADRLGIGRMGEHGALPDAYATFDILVELQKRVSVADPTH
jgi:DNA polymerase III epsilon subunit-like protein